MKSEEIAVQAEKHMMPTFAGFRNIALVRGKGTRVWDPEGRSYLDFMVGISVNNLGHCNEKIIAAVREQVGLLMHTSNLYYIEPTTRLAKMLVENSFADRVFFSNSGAEANEAALKLARKYAKEKFSPEKTDFITFKNSFHGRTAATMAATGQEKFHHGFEPIVPWFSYADFNDLQSVKALVTDKTAAIMVEPVQGEGGFYFSTPEFLRGLRQLCDERQMLLIFDEVQCGLGRMGKAFAYEHYGVTPDIMTLAKSLGGGLPMGATLSTDEISEVFTPGTHGGTMGGNPVVASAALAYCHELFETDLLEKVRERGEQLRARLAEMKSRLPMIVEVRGVGLMNAVQFDRPSGPVNKALENAGLLAGSVAGHSIRFLPPLTVSAEEVDEAMNILERVLQDAS